jgi:hypothetical protein
MIQANELRIGNWVFNPKNNFHFKIDGFHILDLWAGEDCKFIQPIPLTPEILEKAGFEKNGKRFSKDWFYLWSDNYNIVFALAEMEESIGKYLNIEYVHQLQNLYFDLTGQELNIQL